MKVTVGLSFMLVVLSFRWPVEIGFASFPRTNPPLKASKGRSGFSSLYAWIASSVLSPGGIVESCPIC